MPVTALVCPHCEKPVELQVTAVTRSRRCPHCAKHIMLQFAQKQGRVKRKALLVNTTGGLDFEALKNEVPMEQPQPLQGDAFDRMKADPELIAIKKRFAWSAGVVAALMLVATIFHLNRDRWFPQSKKPELAPITDSEAPTPTSLLTKDSRIASAPRPEKKPEKLDFTYADKPVPAPPSSATATSRAQQPTEQNVAPRIGAKNPIPGMSLVTPSGGARSSAASPAGTKTTNMMGSLPKSLFRIAKKKPSVLVEHDLGKAKAALMGFLKAPTAAQRLAFVADPTLVESRFKAFYQKSGDAAVPYASIREAEVVGNGTVSEHDVVLRDGRVMRASVVKNADGGYLVDWPSFVAEGDMDWLDFMHQKVSQPVMLRVAVESGDFFGGDFSDSKWLLCVKLTHPAHPEAPPIFAYVEKQSVLGREMDYWLKLGESQAMPLTVRVKYPPIASADNQVWLSDLVAPGWVLRGSQPVVEAKAPPATLLK